MLEVENMAKCPACGNNTYRMRESFGGYMAMKCSSCGFESGARNQKDFDIDLSSFMRKFKKY